LVAHRHAADVLDGGQHSRPPQQTGSCGYGQVLTEKGKRACDNGFETDIVSAQCYRCEPGHDSRRPSHNEYGSGGCTICAEHYFRPSADSPVIECTSCTSIEGVDCRSNATAATLHVARGYWRSSPLTSKTYRCERTSSGESACTGGSFGDALCLPGHKGPRMPTKASNPSVPKLRGRTASQWRIDSLHSLPQFARSASTRRQAALPTRAMCGLPFGGKEPFSCDQHISRRVARCQCHVRASRDEGPQVRAILHAASSLGFSRKGLCALDRPSLQVQGEL
jgi:hypothetical protein